MSSSILRCLTVAGTVGLAVGCRPSVSGAPAATSLSSATVTAAEKGLVKIGETPWQPWDRWRLDRPSRPALDLYLASDTKKRPVVVMLQGSGCDSLFDISDEGHGKKRFSTGLIFEEAVERELSRPDPRVHFAAIEKRGVVSFSGSRVPRGGLSSCSGAYEAGVSKAERVKDVADAIEAIAKQPWAGPILVAGHSEGGDVAAGVGRALGDRLAAVGIFSAAGPSQLADYVMFANRKGKAGAMRETFAQIEGVLDPQRSEPWEGHSMTRWRSYAVDSTPLDEMRAVDVPVFVVHGTRDENAPIESADVFVIELLRTNPKRSLRYLRIQGADHALATPNRKSYGKAAFERFLTWGLAAKKDRGVDVAPPL